MGAIYEVYIDVLAVNNFLVDLAALLAVNLYRRRNVRALLICLRYIFWSIPELFISVFGKNQNKIFFLTYALAISCLS